MTDFLSGIPEELEGELVGPNEKALVKKSPEEVVRDVVHEIVDETVRVTKDSLYFASIDPQDDDPPAEWVKELGEKKALERLRTAKYALMGAKEAPVGLKIAASLAGSIIKAKSQERNIENNINIVKMFVSAPVPEYPELEVESES